MTSLWPTELEQYTRSKTWITDSFAGDERTLEPNYFIPEKLKALDDPAEFLKFMKKLEEKYWRRFASQI